MKLTAERMNGIKTGYWSPTKKEELVQKLGAIEHESKRWLNLCCSYSCKYYHVRSSGELGDLCAQCPVTELRRLIE